MKRGRPPKDIDELDRDVIPVKLSFHEIKHILFQYRYYQVSSMEGEISKRLMSSLRKWIEKKAKKGNLPSKLVDILMDDSENVPKPNTKNNKNDQREG